ncbi:MAG: uridine-cytidine kinase [Flavobacteriales bacterium]|nr:uridine-cytidine kinase [Flavobacteriales bacterium]MCB9204153.1 uridine-cytidine kinase [Flavobacteriales bacterium]
MAEKHYVVGIAGGSASGKTSFLRQLEESLPKGSVSIISQDNYYKPKAEQQRDENGEVNFDLPSSIDKDAFLVDIQSLLNGKPITFQEYTFNNSERAPETITIQPAPILVVEGLFVFHYPEIRHLLDLRLYLDVREEIKLQRRIKRDRDERGYPEAVVRYQWEHHVLPSFKKFLKPYRDDSHIIITNNITFDKGLAVLTDHLRYRLENELMRASSSEGFNG